MAKKVTKAASISDVIKGRKYKLIIREEYKSLLWKAIFLFVIAYLLFGHIFILARNTGMGMFPSIQDGDLMLGYRLENDFNKNDAVIYMLDGKRTAGRIIAFENEVINMDESGTLYVNGTAQGGEIMYPTYAKEWGTYPYTVPEGTVFILGDYRTQAKDSRDYGAIPLQDIEAKILTLLRRKGI